MLWVAFLMALPIPFRIQITGDVARPTVAARRARAAADGARLHALDPSRRDQADGRRGKFPDWLDRSTPGVQILNQPSRDIGVGARGLQLEEALEGSQRGGSVALLAVALGEAEHGAGVAVVLIERPLE